jgi:hypothetical protein
MQSQNVEILLKTVNQVSSNNLHRKVWKQSPRLLVKLGPNFNSRTSGPKPNLSAILSPFTPLSWHFCIHSALQYLSWGKAGDYQNFTRICGTTSNHLTNSNEQDNRKCYSSPLI